MIRNRGPPCGYIICADLWQQQDGEERGKRDDETEDVHHDGYVSGIHLAVPPKWQKRNNRPCQCPPARHGGAAAGPQAATFCVRPRASATLNVRAAPRAPGSTHHDTIPHTRTGTLQAAQRSNPVSRPKTDGLRPPSPWRFASHRTGPGVARGPSRPGRPGRSAAPPGQQARRTTVKGGYCQTFNT